MELQLTLPAARVKRLAAEDATAQELLPVAASVPAEDVELQDVTSLDAGDLHGVVPHRIRTAKRCLRCEPRIRLPGDLASAIGVRVHGKSSRPDDSDLDECGRLLGVWHRRGLHCRCAHGAVANEGGRWRRLTRRLRREVIGHAMLATAPDAHKEAARHAAPSECELTLEAAREKLLAAERGNTQEIVQVLKLRLVEDPELQRVPRCNAGELCGVSPLGLQGVADTVSHESGARLTRDLATAVEVGGARKALKPGPRNVDVDPRGLHRQKGISSLV
mmetsp:Transcript_73031/g.161590  ORF Transcript_73031/g.161590 Transcript_73031/m.161590 type:complete len:276 (+) Transcript_73031:472-1299(+)